MLTIREVDYAELAPIVAERQGRYMDDDPPRIWFGAFLDGEMVGCCSVQRVLPAVATFRNDYTRIEWRRRGVYRALFRARLGWCRAHGVRFVTTRCTAESLPLYVGFGFVTPPDWPELTPVVADLEAL